LLSHLFFNKCQVKEEVSVSSFPIIGCGAYGISRLFCSQIFGPVLAVGKFNTEAEAISLANNTSYGLGAGLHSSAFVFLLLQLRRMLFPSHFLNVQVMPTSACGFLLPSRPER
jgi:hypothetical protein